MKNLIEPVARLDTRVIKFGRPAFRTLKFDFYYENRLLLRKPSLRPDHKNYDLTSNNCKGNKKTPWRCSSDGLERRIHSPQVPGSIPGAASHLKPYKFKSYEVLFFIFLSNIS